LKDTITVRRCTPADAGRVLDLWREGEATASPTDAIPELVRAASAPALCFVLAELHGRLIGTAMGGFDGWRGNLYRLVVHPEFRLRGIARALVGEIERHFAAENVTRVSALVEHDHPWAVAFWTAVGYQLDPRMARFVKMLRV
jgi:ribosomal protein S18 acetylase RimI-like enzyme